MTAYTKRRWRWIVALFFMLAGANHFLNPGPYLSMMPSFLPGANVLVAVSGGAEILGGAGLFFSGSFRAAGWGLIALLVAVFPANVNVALHRWPGVNLPPWSLWLRLPLQFVAIWWVYRIACDTEKNQKTKPE